MEEKGYYTGYCYMGFVDGNYRAFGTEQEYHDYLMYLKSKERNKVFDVVFESGEKVTVLASSEDDAVTALLQSIKKTTEAKKSCFNCKYGVTDTCYAIACGYVDGTVIVQAAKRYICSAYKPKGDN